MQRVELVQLDALEHGRAEERAQARQQLRGGDTQRVAAEHAQQHGVVLQLEAREPPVALARVQVPLEAQQP